MVCVSTRNNEIVLFHAGESLVAQTVEWVRENPTWVLELADARRNTVINAILVRVSAAIVDATADPGTALDICMQAEEDVRRHKLVVYTEIMHEGLELFVRTRGILLLLGPMELAEWTGFFSPRSSNDSAGDVCLDRTEETGAFTKPAGSTMVDPTSKDEGSSIRRRNKR